MNYIDVSEWQGVIDWEQVRPHIDGAMLRAGFGRGTPDRQFDRNAAECNRLGIPCGAYWFSYAASAAEAEAEAAALLDTVKPWRMELPLAWDFEYDSVTHAALKGVTVTRSLASAMALAFCSAVERGGYWALNYANPDFLGRYFDASVPARFGLWLAQWSGKGGEDDRPGGRDGVSPPRPCAIWQWSPRGSVPGIRGFVDLDVSETDFAALIRARGLNRLGQADPADPAGGKPPAHNAAADPDPAGGKPPASPGADAEKTAASAALAWARGAGLLPEGAEADAPLTLAAGAALLRRYHLAFSTQGKAEGRTDP